MYIMMYTPLLFTKESEKQMDEIRQYTGLVVGQIREKLTVAGLLPLREQAKVSTKILEDRLQNLLPQLMEETGFDMWIVAGSETNEDPVMWTLVTPDTLYARRCNALIFYRNPEDGSMKYLSWMAGGEMSNYYENVGTSKDTFLEVVQRVCDRLNPKKIGININSDLGGFCGGLSAWLYLELQKLTEPYKKALCPAGRLSTRWLETMTEEEKKVMAHLTEVTEDIMRAFYSRELIKPGVTTVQDVMWWIKDVMARCELNFWFAPHLDYQRQVAEGEEMNMWAPQAEIQEGDILHCDIGVNLKHIRVMTDRQWMAYLRKEGEEHAPLGLQNLIARGNLFQDLVCEEFRVGHTGEDVFFRSMEKARNAGLKPMLYCHGLGTFGHGAGPIVGLYDCQEGGFPRGDLPVGYSSTHALELQHAAPLPEWGNQEIHIMLEEDINITDEPHYFGHRQTEIYEF